MSRRWHRRSTAGAVCFSGTLSFRRRKISNFACNPGSIGSSTLHIGPMPGTSGKLTVRCDTNSSSMTSPWFSVQANYSRAALPFVPPSPKPSAAVKGFGDGETTAGLPHPHAMGVSFACEALAALPLLQPLLMAALAHLFVTIST
jgi:hypothetical protein